MSSNNRTSADLDDLRELGRPKPNDDEQTVAFRSLVRATLITIENQHILEDKFDSVASSLAKLSDIPEDIKELQELHRLIAPPGDPSRHLLVRMSALEEDKKSVVGFIKSHSGSIALALLYGGWRLLSNLK